MGYFYVVTNSTTYHLADPGDVDRRALCGFTYEANRTASVVMQQPTGKFVMCKKCGDIR